MPYDTVYIQLLCTVFLLVLLHIFAIILNNGNRICIKLLCILFITKEVCFHYRQSQRLLDDANETHCQWIMLLVWKRLNINQRHYTYVYIVPNISISIGLKAQTQYSFSILIPLKKQVQTEWNQFQRRASIFFIYKLKARTACPVKSKNNSVKRTRCYTPW